MALLEDAEVLAAAVHIMVAEAPVDDVSSALLDAWAANGPCSPELPDWIDLEGFARPIADFDMYDCYRLFLRAGRSSATSR